VTIETTGASGATDQIDPIERKIARILSIGAVVAITLLVIGIALMIVEGVGPETVGFPAFHLERLVDDLVHLRAAGFLYAGILVVIATPVVRVSGELIGFAIRREREMALVAAAILLVVVVSVVVAVIIEAS
jgi:uncharacterized membrane protein